MGDVIELWKTPKNLRFDQSFVVRKLTSHRYQSTPTMPEEGKTTCW